jgi:hypothetical protein
MLARRTNLIPGSAIPAPGFHPSIKQPTYRDQKWFRMSHEERAEYLRTKWLTAETVEAAADAVGCTANTLSLAARAMGLPGRGRGKRRRAG